MFRASAANKNERCLIFGALFPSKPGLIHKHTVKHTVNHGRTSITIGEACKSRRRRPLYSKATYSSRERGFDVLHMAGFRMCVCVCRDGNWLTVVVQRLVAAGLRTLFKGHVIIVFCLCNRIHQCLSSRCPSAGRLCGLQRGNQTPKYSSLQGFHWSLPILLYTMCLQ